MQTRGLFVADKERRLSKSFSVLFISTRKKKQKTVFRVICAFFCPKEKKISRLFLFCAKEFMLARLRSTVRVVGDWKSTSRTQQSRHISSYESRKRRRESEKKGRAEISWEKFLSSSQRSTSAAANCFFGRSDLTSSLFSGCCSIHPRPLNWRGERKCAIFMHFFSISFGWLLHSGAESVGSKTERERARKANGLTWRMQKCIEDLQQQ